MTIIEKLAKHIPYLTSKDQALGKKYLEERNFNSLIDLINYSIKEVKNTIKEYKLEPLEVNLNNLYRFKSDVILYKSYSEMDDDEFKYEMYD